MILLGNSPHHLGHPIDSAYMSPFPSLTYTRVALCDSRIWIEGRRPLRFKSDLIDGLWTS